MPSLRVIPPSLVALLVIALTGGARAADFEPGEVLVEFAGQATAVVSGARDVSTVRPGLVRLTLPDGVTVDEALADYAGRPGVVHVQPNYRYRVQRVPNDPEFGQQWALRNTGGNIRVAPTEPQPVPGADIAAPAAWDRTTGGKDPKAAPIVAIIDTGIDTTHPDLIDNLWSGPNGEQDRKSVV